MKRISPKKLARIAGVLYLVIFLVAPFPFLLGREAAVVPGDAAATAENLVANQSVIRIGMAAETVVFLIETIMAGMFYVLLRPVSRHLSLASAFARLGEAVVQAVNLLPTMIALMLAGGAGLGAARAIADREELALLFMDANGFVILVWGFFFGLHLLLLGSLVYRSTFWPRILGILLIIAGFAYLAEGYVRLLAPHVSSVMAVAVPVLAVPGELAFTVWLLWKGLDVDRWNAMAADAAAI
jgi:hypothetical protein